MPERKFGGVDLTFKKRGSQIERRCFQAEEILERKSCKLTGCAPYGAAGFFSQRCRRL